jgi:hypothetical protein
MWIGQERNHGKRNMIESDTEIRSLFLNNKINHSNIKEFLDKFNIPFTSRKRKIREIDLEVDMIKKYYGDILKESGFIFLIPTGRRDGSVFVYYIKTSRSELDRIFNLKAFW